MSMTSRLGTEGLWCPACGEWIDNDCLDQDEIAEIEEGGDVYFICPWCGESFYVTGYD